MKIKDRLLSGACAALLFAGSALPSGSVLLAAEAAEVPAFSVSSVTGRQGETVTVTVSVNNNPGIVALRLYVGYNSSAVRISSAEGAMISKEGSDPVPVTNGDISENPMKMTWVDGLHGDYTYNGTLMTLELEIADDAVPGDYPLTLDYDPEDVFDTNYNNVAFAVKEGTVTVKKKCIHSFDTEVIAPTCTEGGYTLHTCSKCGDSYTDSETKALGHEYTSKVTKDPSCTQTGIRTYTCVRCPDSYTEVIKALGHNYEEKAVPPTCTEGGYTVHTCSRCKDSYTDSETKALGHDYKTEVIAPTRTEGGYTLHTCSRCKDSYKDNFTDPLGDQQAPMLTGKVELVSTKPDYSGVTLTLTGPDGKAAEISVGADGSFEAPAPLEEGIYELTARKDKSVPVTEQITGGKDWLSLIFKLYLYGDCDGNGTVNMKDIAIMQRYINGWDVPIIVSAADLNGVNGINMKDLAMLQRFINGWEITFGEA